MRAADQQVFAAPASTPGLVDPRATPWPRSDHVWGLLAVGLPVLATLLGALSATDLAYQVRAGEIMLQTHHVLRTDPFTFTMTGHAWLNQQWGAQLLIGLIFQFGGWIGIDLAWGVLTGTSCLLLYLTCRTRRATARDACLLTLAAFLVGLQVFDMRPQLIGIALFALTQLVIAQRREHPRRLWFLPLIVVVWVNVHGSFPLVFALLGVACIEDLYARVGLRTLIAVSAVTTIATFAGPFGPRVWTYVVSLSTNPTVSHLVFEWSHPTPRSLIGAAFYLSAGIVLVHVLRARRRIAWPTHLTLGVFFVLAAFALRNVVWWGLAGSAAIAGTLPPKAEAAEDERPIVNRAIAAALLAGILVVLPFWRGLDATTGGPIHMKIAPQALASVFARRLPAGSHVFVSQTMASWVEFSLPQDSVMVDSRIEVFPSGIWDQYFDLSAARPGWRRIIDRWSIDGAILNGQAAPLIDALRHDSAWEFVGYADGAYGFLRR